jgi:hypothetical protein
MEIMEFLQPLLLLAVVLEVPVLMVLDQRALLVALVVAVVVERVLGALLLVVVLELQTRVFLGQQALTVEVTTIVVAVVVVLALLLQLKTVLMAYPTTLLAQA